MGTRGTGAGNKTAQPITLGGTTVAPGERQRIEIPVARLPTETWLPLPVEVVHGRRPGHRIWLSAAVHGDEVNGIEIIRQVLAQTDPAELCGSLVAVPIVNLFGFINQSRYLPDRRDLNRCFPGSERGSLASRLAHLLMTEIVSRCTHGIDLHTGSLHRANLPHIRTDMDNPETAGCARAFGPPVVMHARTRDGSLREAATERGIAVLLYEAGEPLRFDAEAIRLGIEGILRVMKHLDMLPNDFEVPAPQQPVEVRKSSWIRARRSGILRLQVQLGARVRKRQPLGIIADAFGDNRVTVKASFDGLVLGQTNNPVVNQGDGIVHLARTD